LLPTIRPVALRKVIEPPTTPSISEEEFAQIWGDFTSAVRTRIARAKNYPSSAREDGLEGKAFLVFKIRKDGRALDIEVAQSSGHIILDKAAKRAVEKAAPFPPIPDKLNRNFALLKIPISFILR
jgi:protein TonB